MQPPRQGLVGIVFLAVVLEVGCSDDEPAPPVRAERASASCPRSAFEVRERGRTRCVSVKAGKEIYADLARVRDQGAVGEQAFATVARRRRVPIAIVHAVARRGAAANWPLPTAPELPEPPIRSGADTPAATRLAATTRCSQTEPGSSVASLRWRPAARRGRMQRIELTIFRNFATGKPESSGPLAPGCSRFEWHRVHGQAIHSWRVLTRHRRGWVPSVTARFTGPTCPVDNPGGGPTP